MSVITLHTIFENKETLKNFSRIFKVSIEDFDTEDNINYLNEKFPTSLDKQVQSLFNLRILKGWTFCNFWEHSIGKLDKIYLNHLNLDGLGLIGIDLAGADFSHSSLVRTYFRSANLENANFESANLENAYLMKANLKGANFLNANLDKAQMAGSISDITN